MRFFLRQKLQEQTEKTLLLFFLGGVPIFFFVGANFRGGGGSVRENIGISFSKKLFSKLSNSH